MVVIILGSHCHIIEQQDICMLPVCDQTCLSSIFYIRLVKFKSEWCHGCDTEVILNLLKSKSRNIKFMKSFSTVIKGLGLARIRLWNQLQSLRTLVLSESMHSRLVGDLNLIPVRPANCSTEWLEQWKKGHPKFFLSILVKGIIS